MNGHPYSDLFNSVLAAYRSKTRVSIEPLSAALCSREKLFKAVSDGFPGAEVGAERTGPKASSGHTKRWNERVLSSPYQQWKGRMLLAEYFPQLTHSHEFFDKFNDTDSGEAKPMGACGIDFYRGSELGISPIKESGGSRDCEGYWCVRLLQAEFAVESRVVLEQNFEKMEFALAQVEAKTKAPQIATSTYVQVLLDRVLGEVGVFPGVLLSGPYTCNVQEVLRDFFRFSSGYYWRNTEMNRSRRKSGEFMALSVVSLSVEDFKPGMERALRDAAATASLPRRIRGGTYGLTPTAETNRANSFAAAEADAAANNASATGAGR